MGTEIKFVKMHGAENDFILFDEWEYTPPELNRDFIQGLCDRKAGIGADGVLILRKVSGFDFELLYLNSDGLEGSMCGNGARCALKRAEQIRGKSEFNFLAADGEHRGWVEDEIVKVTVFANSKINKLNTEGRDGFLVDTGSPHFVTDLLEGDAENLHAEGRKIRRSSVFKDGVNVDFIERKGEDIFVRTYERGVESETRSCGTGAVAVALTLMENSNSSLPLKLQFPGGILTVNESDRNGELILEGPTKKVFEGVLTI